MSAASSSSSAIPLITYDETSGLFSTCPEALSWLRALTSAKLSVVSIAGTYRTGKSFLLNQLADGGTFNVGSSVKACTKGIWLYGGAKSLSDGTTCLFLDTEGMGSTSRSEGYDVKLFSLALLLSSVFLYNSVGTIDGHAIARLGLVAQLTKNIHTRAQPMGRAEDPGTEFASFFPSFTWIVRDMTVRLERDGRKISAKEYLEDALKPEDGLSDEAESKNAIRGMLRAFFPERDCVTLVRPVADETALQALAQTTETKGLDATRQEFKTGVEALRRRVLATALARPKILYGKALNGSLFASLVEAYVTALNAGGAPVISNAWERVVDAQGAAASVKAAAAAQTLRAAAAISAPNGVLEIDVLEQTEAAAEREAFSVFAKLAVADARTMVHEDSLRATLRSEAARFSAANEAASKVACEGVLVTALASAKVSITSGARAGAAAVATAAASAASAAATTSGDPMALGARAASAAARAAAPTVEVVARAHRDAATALWTLLEEKGCGPSRARVMLTALRGPLGSALSDASASIDEASVSERGAADAVIASLHAALVAAQGAEVAAVKAGAASVARGEAALSAAGAAAAVDIARARDAVAAKDAELLRLADRMDRLSSGLEMSGSRATEAAAAAASDLATARSRIEELLTARSDTLLAVATVSQRLAAAEAARGDSERATSDAARALAAEERACALLIERVKTSENETMRLREQTELLYEANRAAKEAAAAERAAKEDIELQLGEEFLDPTPPYPALPRLPLHYVQHASYIYISID